MFSRRRLISGIVSISAFGLLSASRVSVASAAPKTPLVAAAASLRFALPEISRAFAKEAGFAPRLSFGSSGNLARQIRQGAPFELFLSADDALVVELFRGGRTADAGAPYALGRLVVFAPEGSPVKIDARLEGVKAALESGAIRRFAIANPEHAPYGRAAREVLQRSNLWDALASKLVFGENISQAAQFAVSGSCECALISQSLALAPGLADRGAYAMLPQDWHDPLRHRMVQLAGAGDGAQAFYAFLTGPTAQEIFTRHGFASPGQG